MNRVEDIGKEGIVISATAAFPGKRKVNNEAGSVQAENRSVAGRNVILSGTDSGDAARGGF